MTLISKIDEKHIDKNEIKKQAEILKKGNTVIFPTETVYGLGANALDEVAVSKIYEAKGRPSDNPLIVHIYDKKQVNQLAENINEKAEKYLKNKVHLEMLLQISKELINNIFKHSNATYIKYEIKLDENMVLIINCKSDGASAIDYENIFKSKGGVLLLRVLVEANNGKLTYNYSNGILWSSVELEVD